MRLSRCLGQKSVSATLMCAALQAIAANPAASGECLELVLNAYPQVPSPSHPLRLVDCPFSLM